MTKALYKKLEVADRKYREHFPTFLKATDAYRAREIGDDEYFAHRKKHDALLKECHKYHDAISHAEDKPKKRRKKTQSSVMEVISNFANDPSKNYMSDRYDNLGRPHGIDHIGITVPDMGEATNFLGIAFDAHIVYDLCTPANPRSGSEMESNLALPKGAVIQHQRLMQINNGPSIEMFQFSGVTQRDAHMLQDFGIQHFTIFVEDMEKAYAAALEAGGLPYNKPHHPSSYEGAPGNQGVYIRPPWGGIIELFSYNKILYPKGTQFRRWTPPPGPAYNLAMEDFSIGDGNA